jgi:uncharacterized protein YjbI with pentapeptide repeats
LVEEAALSVNPRPTRIGGVSLGGSGRLVIERSRKRLLGVLDALVSFVVKRDLPVNLGPRFRFFLVRAAGVAAITPGISRTRIGRLAFRFLIMRKSLGDVLELLQGSKFVSSYLAMRFQHVPDETLKYLSTGRQVHMMLRTFVGAAWRVDLSGFKFQNVDWNIPMPSPLEDACLDGSELLGVRILGDISCASMRGLKMVHSSIVSSGADSVDLSDASIRESHFLYSNCWGGDFARARLERVTFEDVNLTNASFVHCVLDDVVFEQVNLDNADFSASDIKSAVFIDCSGVSTIKPEELASQLSNAAGSVKIENGVVIAEPALAVIGATPGHRHRYSNRVEDEAAQALVQRYGLVAGQRRPPLSYRAEVLFGEIAGFIVSFPNYGKMKKHAWVKLTEDYPELSKQFVASQARHPVLGALWDFVTGGSGIREQFLLGVEMPFWDARKWAEARLGDWWSDVNLLFVESQSLHVRYVRSQGHRYVLVSQELAVHLIRMAKYSIGWVSPDGVTVAEEYAGVKFDGRPFIEHWLSEVLAGRAIATDVPLIQITGIRRLSAEALNGTWLRFAISHELAHGLPDDVVAQELSDVAADARYELMAVGEGSELGCDVLAARILADHNEDMDGDELLADMLDVLPDDDIDEVVSAMFAAEEGRKLSSEERGVVSAMLAGEFADRRKWLIPSKLAGAASWVATSCFVFLVLFSSERKKLTRAQLVERTLFVIEKGMGLQERERLEQDLNSHDLLAPALLRLLSAPERGE